METKIQLTKRQYALRRFLWANRTDWVSSKNIFNNVIGYDSARTAYKQINADVHAINDSGIYDKIIITDRCYGYKLATKKEFSIWSRKNYAECVRKIDYVNKLIKTARLDGQGIIPGLEGYQRDFYEKFVDEGEENKPCKKKDANSQSTSSVATAS